MHKNEYFKGKITYSRELFQHYFEQRQSFFFMSGIVCVSTAPTTSPRFWPSHYVIMRITTAAAVPCMLMTMYSNKSGQHIARKDVEKKTAKLRYERNI